MKKDINELVQYIKDYSILHYEDGGWDVIHECWGDKEILEVLSRDKATTEKKALASFKPIVGYWKDQQADAAFHRREAIGDEKQQAEDAKQEVEFYKQFNEWRGDSNGTVGVD